MSISHSVFLAAMLLGSIVPRAAVAMDNVDLVVTTQINSPDPQAGIKSVQKINVNFVKRTVTETFSTGVTTIGPVELKSVRDQFSVKSVFSPTGLATLNIAGQTASGVLFMPNINYKFTLEVDKNGRGTFSGCHDGYPAYEVKVQAKIIYSFKHKNIDLVKLFGECDQIVSAKTF